MPLTRRSRERRMPVHHFPMWLLIFVLSVIELALAAQAVSWVNESRGIFEPAFRRRIKFLLFVAVWSVILSIIMLLLSILYTLFRWTHHAGTLIFTSILWLIAAALLESQIGDANDSSLCGPIIGGSRCSKLKAIRGIAWTLFGLTFLFSILQWVLRKKDDRVVTTGHTTAHPVGNTTRTVPAGTTTTTTPHAHEMRTTTV